MFAGVDEPAVLNLKMTQGACWNKVIILKDNLGVPLDLTGCEAKMQIRPSVTDSTVLLELSTANGRITIVGTEGKLFLAVGHIYTALLSDDAVYDLDIMIGTCVYTILRGQILLILQVTR